MGPAAIGAALSKIPTAWAIPIAGFLGLITYDLTTFCTDDPPAIPVVDWTAEALTLLSILNPVARVQAVKNFSDLIGHYLWYDFCECTAGGTPTPPGAPPAAPIDFPLVDPPIIGASPAGVCFAADSGVITIPAATGPFIPPFYDLPIPNTATFVSATLENLSGNGNAIAGWGLFQRPTAGSNTGASYLLQTAVSTADGAKSTLSGGIVHPTWFYGPIPSNTNGTACKVRVTASFYCGSSPGQPSAPCCPPDPTLTAMLQNIWQQVSLIQRQAVPFGYVPGTVHSALSGAGSFSIQGILGAKVDVTTLPSSYGRSGTNPTEYFDLGFVSFGTADGWPTSYRLEHDPTMMLPARCGLYTDLEYDLAPGVVVTITELLREP